LQIGGRVADPGLGRHGRPSQLGGGDLAQILQTRLLAGDGSHRRGVLPDEAARLSSLGEGHADTSATAWAVASARMPGGAVSTAVKAAAVACAAARAAGPSAASARPAV